jgi:hypothetical protein
VLHLTESVAVPPMCCLQLRTVLSYGQQQRMQALYQAALSATTKVSCLQLRPGVQLHKA